jgi:hypothetical protein
MPQPASVACCMRPVKWRQSLLFLYNIVMKRDGKGSEWLAMDEECIVTMEGGYFDEICPSAVSSDFALLIILIQFMIFPVYFLMIIKLRGFL